MRTDLHLFVLTVTETGCLKEAVPILRQRLQRRNKAGCGDAMSALQTLSSLIERKDRGFGTVV